MSVWSECNNLCDGEQYRTAACKQIDNGRTVSPNMCRNPKPDDQYQVCNAGCVVECVYRFICIITTNSYLNKFFQFRFQMGNPAIKMFGRMWRRASTIII